MEFTFPWTMLNQIYNLATEACTRILGILLYHTLSAFEAALFPSPRFKCLQTPPVNFPVFCFAHRGGGLEMGPDGCLLLENTLPAFRNAKSVGADLLELDVQMTRDGVIVVFHDINLGRMCGPAYEGVRIEDLDFADLPHLYHTALHTGTGVCKGVHEQTPPPLPHSIPTLEAVLKEFGDMPIQIDVKVHRPGLVRALHTLIQTHNCKHILWGSFNHEIQCQLYVTNPQIPLFTSAWRAVYIRAAHLAGALDKVHIYESACIVPWRMPVSALWGKAVVEEGARALHMHPFLDGAWVADMAARGVLVVLFGRDLNSADVFAHCTRVACQAICTDRPSDLQGFIQAPEFAGYVRRTTATAAGVGVGMDEHAQGSVSAGGDVAVVTEDTPCVAWGLSREGEGGQHTHGMVLAAQGRGAMGGWDCAGGGEGRSNAGVAGWGQGKAGAGAGGGGYAVTSSCVHNGPQWQPRPPQQGGIAAYAPPLQATQESTAAAAAAAAAVEGQVEQMHPAPSAPAEAAAASPRADAGGVDTRAVHLLPRWGSALDMAWGEAVQEPSNGLPVDDRWAGGEVGVHAGAGEKEEEEEVATAPGAEPNRTGTEGAGTVDAGAESADVEKRGATTEVSGAGGSAGKGYTSKDNPGGVCKEGGRKPKHGKRR